MKKRYRLLLSLMFLGSVMVPTSSLEADRKKPPRRAGNARAARDRGQLTSLDTLRTFTLNVTQGTQQSQNQNATPTAIPPPSTATAPQGTQRQQSQHVTIRNSQAEGGGRPGSRRTNTSMESLKYFRLTGDTPGTQQSQNHNATPATPPPPPREAEKTQTSQQSSEKKTSTSSVTSNPSATNTKPNPFAPPASPKPNTSFTPNPFSQVVFRNENTTNSQSVANDSLNQAEQPTIPQSQEQQTPPTSEATSGDTTTDWDTLFGEPAIDFDHVDPDELEQPNKMISTPVASTESPQLSDPNNASPDGVTVNNNQTQAPNPASTMSVKRGIALLQGLNIALDGSSRPSPEDREMAADAAHEVLLDLNAIYHYEGDGSTGSISKFSSRFGQKLFAWLGNHSFANFRKESDKEAMRAFAQKLLAKFEGDADFRRECEMLEESFIQEQEDYQTNCARACMQVVSLFLHPETV